MVDEEHRPLRWMGCERFKRCPEERAVVEYLVAVDADETEVGPGDRGWKLDVLGCEFETVADRVHAGVDDDPA